MAYNTTVVIVLKDGSRVEVQDIDVKDYKQAEDVIGIQIYDFLPITDSTIFQRYKILTVINGPLKIDTTNLSGLFENTIITECNLSKCDMSKVTNMNYMFRNSLYNKELNWDTSNVTSMDGMFDDSKFNQPLRWNTMNVTSMEGMFRNSVYDWGLGHWDVSRVINMLGMFQNSVYNRPLNDWKVYNVTNMRGMFQNSRYNHPLNAWVVYNVNDMRNMFNDSQFNHPINMWNVVQHIHKIDMFNSHSRYSFMNKELKLLD